MKRFLFFLIIYAIPLVVVSIGLEVFIKTSESAYLLKSNYFKQVKYRLLVLGSSHNQNDINPAHMDLRTCNAAMGSQDLKMDLALFKKAVTINDSIKYLILELSYHRFRENPPNYWRNSLNEYFYGVNLTNNFNLFKYFLLGSNLKFFRNYFGELISSSGHKYEYNIYGFDENDFDGIFKDLKYDTSKVKNIPITRINEGIGTSNSISYLNEINELCLKKNIQLLLVAPPVYRSYSKSFDPARLMVRDSVVDALKHRNEKIIWLNFEQAPNFSIRDFKNDNHLNSHGAQLFTQQLSDSLYALGLFR